jgi:hypothetical protein
MGLRADLKVFNQLMVLDVINMNIIAPGIGLPQCKVGIALLIFFCVKRNAAYQYEQEKKRKK